MEVSAMKAVLCALCACLGVTSGATSAVSLTPPLPKTPPDGAMLFVPLPDRNPLRIAPAEPVAPPPPPHPSELEAPDWSAQEVQAARDQCVMMLDDTGTVYRHLDPLRAGVCGTPAPIELSAVGKNPSVRIEPPAIATCGLAASLGAWADGTLQPAARKHLGKTVTAIRNVASYVCRNRYNSAGKPISEHARANALDMAAFRTDSGEWITVLDNWALPPVEAAAAPAETAVGVTRAAPGELANPSPAEAAEAATRASSPPPPVPKPEPEPAFKPESAFLNDIHAGACALFGTALGPLANEAHKDHFHYDLAERQHGNFCE
jgi:hypothetical protein